MKERLFEILSLIFSFYILSKIFFVLFLKNFTLNQISSKQLHRQSDTRTPENSIFLHNMKYLTKDTHKIYNKTPPINTNSQLILHTIFKYFLLPTLSTKNSLSRLQIAYGVISFSTFTYRVVLNLDTQ